MRFLIHLLIGLALAADAPKPLTDAQRAEVEKARAIYWQTRAEAMEAQLRAIEADRRMKEAEQAAAAVLRKYQVDGYQLNEALVYVPAPKKSEGK